ncbi:hypothetical protein [Paenibacillus bouchesdurhonensis]|uniref:hypothetical protein n=1 Tax=Paenibacillus bouchesdurhonensis TaxID=1870990 RepID=UPI000DA611BD|nr:hypothetical protein [Paenibacillus bouchesdurhonensis]
MEFRLLNVNPNQLMDEFVQVGIRPRRVIFDKLTDGMASLTVVNVDESEYDIAEKVVSSHVPQKEVGRNLKLMSAD